MSVIELKISEKILAGTEVEVDSEVIGSKDRCEVISFKCSMPDSSLAYVRIEYGLEILWSAQRGESLTHVVEFRGNGVDTLKLVCSNECSNDYYFNAICKVTIDG